MIGNYKFITLCGSTKFKDQYIQIQKELTLQGNIVLSLSLYGHSGDNEAWIEDNKKMLEDMQKIKIDIADEIFVINVGGYIGPDTRKEIEYAKSVGKPIRYLIQEECSMKDMIDINKWTEVVTGIYRYNVSGKLYYEIIVLYKEPMKDLLDSIASLYVFGHNNKDVFHEEKCYERACMVLRGTVQECINTAFNTEEKMSTNTV